MEHVRNVGGNQTNAAVSVEQVCSTLTGAHGRAAAHSVRVSLALRAFQVTLCIYFLVPSLIWVAWAQGAGGGVDSREFFEKRIRPVLANHCFACHTDLQTSGLRVDSRERLLKGGNSGPAIVPGDPDQSLLIRAVSHTHERLKMPPKGTLRGDEIADLRAWIKSGAHWPVGSDAPAPARTRKHRVITAEQKAFWSFQALSKPSLPQVKNKSWPKSAIDYFILSQLEGHGIEPVGAADKRTLIRRVSFDLIGLPPTPSETELFLQDSSPSAFAKVVDRLLASAHYGERWGRYWLDVARYGEDDNSVVDEVLDAPYQNAWRYRDWVVEVFNKDMPYDLFVKAQIGGDLLEAGNPERSLVGGLGFFALGPWHYTNPTPAQARAEELSDRVDALTRGFLGLTVACARCHDHKYDPISMQDYYALAGVFANSPYQEYPLVSKSVVQEYSEPKQKFEQRESELEEFPEIMCGQLTQILTRSVSRYMVAAWKVLGAPKLELLKVAEQEKLDRETLEGWAKYLGNPEKDHPYLQAWNELLANGGTAKQARKVADEFQALVLSVTAERKAIERENSVILARAKKTISQRKTPNGLVSNEDLSVADGDIIAKALERNKFMLWFNLFIRPEGFYGAGSGTAINDKDAGVLICDEKTLERFLEGEWKSQLISMRAELKALRKNPPKQYPYLHGIAESENPVDMRIHLRGNPSNLGEEAPRRFLAVLSRGEPTPFRKGSGRFELAEAVVGHPLTARVMVNRIWKQLFGDGIVRTPSNFGWRGERPSHPELLDHLASRFAENNKWSIKAMIREIVLSATYQSSSDYSKKNFAEDPDNRLFWRQNRRRLDAEALRDYVLFASGGLDCRAGGPSAELNSAHKRRTIYATVSRRQVNYGLTLFDFPDPGRSSAGRVVTNVPLQRLFFLNSDFMLAQAAALVDRLQAEVGADNAEKIHKAYQLLFTREADEPELLAGLEFLRGDPTDLPGKPSAWQQYAQVLLSSNEFLFVD